MRKFFGLFAAMLALSLVSFGFIACSNDDDDDDSPSAVAGTSSSGSGSSGGSSTSSTYTTVAGGTFKTTTSGITWTITFNSDKSLSGSINGTSLSNYNWKESGKTVTVYLDFGSSQQTIYTFSANSSFTTLTYNPSGSSYGSIKLERQ